MPCGDHVSAQFFRGFPECGELYLSVTQHVRIGRATFRILVEHIVHDPFPIDLTQIHKIERNPDFSRHHLRNKAVLLPLAFAVQGRRGIVPVLHEQPEDVISLSFQQKCCDA